MAGFSYRQNFRMIRSHCHRQLEVAKALLEKEWNPNYRYWSWLFDLAVCYIDMSRMGLIQGVPSKRGEIDLKLDFGVPPLGLFYDRFRGVSGPPLDEIQSLLNQKDVFAQLHETTFDNWLSERIRRVRNMRFQRPGRRKVLDVLYCFHDLIVQNPLRREVRQEPSFIASWGGVRIGEIDDFESREITQVMRQVAIPPLDARSHLQPRLHRTIERSLSKYDLARIDAPTGKPGDYD